MKTIKVIDLLNKIANGEEVPKKIKYDGEVYEDEPMYFIYEVIGKAYEKDFKNFLNDEVEIIEEKKIEIDKYKIFIDEKDAYTYIYNKLIEVVDVVNEMSANK